MEEGVLSYIFNFVKGLNIADCDIYLNRPTIVGDKEVRNDTYVIISFPDGFINMDAIAKATGVITIGAKDRILGLPQVNEITRVANILKSAFPILTDEYSFLDFEFSSDDSQGTGWHEYYYTFQLYINSTN